MVEMAPTPLAGMENVARIASLPSMGFNHSIAETTPPWTNRDYRPWFQTKDFLNGSHSVEEIRFNSSPVVVLDAKYYPLTGRHLR